MNKKQLSKLRVFFSLLVNSIAFFVSVVLFIFSIHSLVSYGYYGDALVVLSIYVAMIMYLSVTGLVSALQYIFLKGCK